MKFPSLLKHSLLAAALFTSTQCIAVAEPQVMATVGEYKITADDLEMALASSPFATQFPSMEMKDQAALRGGMLQRLVSQRLMTLEAKNLGLEKDPKFQDELEEFRLGLLYRYYMDKLRAQITIPADVADSIKQQFKDDPDGAAAAKSAYRVDRYRDLRFATIQSLRDRYHIKLHEDRIHPGMTPDDTVLLEGDGIQITYGHIIRDQRAAKNPEWIKEQLYKRAELLTIAKAADAEHVDVSKQVDHFAAERLPAMLMERKQREWTKSEEDLRAFYKANPQIGRLQERRHIGQLVTATKAEAEALRARILKGESLFELAEKYSIDPYGRSHKGDMGWQMERTGHPAIEPAIANLKDGEVSEVIQTPAGFHLVTILERRPGGQKTFESIRDRIQQVLITEQMAGYMTELGTKYKVVWNVVAKQPEQ